MMNRSNYDRSRHQMGNQSFADRGEGYQRDDDRYDLQGGMYDEDERFQRMPSQQFGGYRNQDLGRGYGRHEPNDQNFAGGEYGEQGRERWGSSNQGMGMMGGQGRWRHESQGWGGQGQWQGNQGWRGNQGYGSQGLGGYDRYGGYGGQGYGQGSQMGQMGQGYGQQSWGNQGYGQSHQGWGGQQGYGQSHFGGERSQRRQWRAPKGYTRSDERIREEVCDRLGMEFDASEIEVKVAEGEVTLSGSIHDRGEKYRIEELVEGLGGVKNVHNLLQVKREQEETSTSSTSHQSRGTEENGRNMKRQQQATQH